MAINPHVLATHHVGYSFLLSSPATTQEGAVSGYFADTLTQLFLGLDKYNYLLHARTYGPEEPGAAPTKFSLLTGGNYDWLFLPFVPRNHNFAGPLAFHERNKQWLVRHDALKSL
jgi:hypothetical protein